MRYRKEGAVYKGTSEQVMDRELAAKTGWICVADLRHKQLLPVAQLLNRNLMAIELFDSDWQSVEKLIDLPILVMRLMTGIQPLVD